MKTGATRTGNVAVIDIGKTNAKLVLVDAAALVERAVITRPNAVRPGPPWPHVDTDAIWAFLLDGLAAFHARHGIDAVSVTTHGACAALLAADGSLAAPILDYEHDGPDAMAAEYDALRPDFTETGSPRLGMGLNVGAQLHWQFAIDPTLKARTRRIVTYPQYWGFRLTGVAATDVTSLGCHTDLWDPHRGRFSSLVERLGIADRIAPPRRPDAVLGPVLPDIAARTGLAPDTPVLCGIHDSNASLLPHLLGNAPPFAVVSTGTWVVVMAIGGGAVTLDPDRDTLVNVNALGQPVPSARFMGGREHDIACGGACPAATDAALRAVLDAGVMLLPAVEPGSGPFRGRAARWIGDAPPEGSAARGAAVALYLALMTETCLANVGRAGPIIVEGPFARNDVYLRALAALTGTPVIAAAGQTGTGVGAAMLWHMSATPRTAAALPDPALPLARDVQTYGATWRRHCRD